MAVVAIAGFIISLGHETVQKTATDRKTAKSQEIQTGKEKYLVPQLQGLGIEAGSSTAATLCPCCC